MCSSRTMLTKNMQRNIGVIKQSNLCIEIMEASKPSYTPQCTLGSINLSEHESEKTIKHSVKVLTRMLNRVIDKNKWSDDWSKNAGEDQRALAIGVAGWQTSLQRKKLVLSLRKPLIGNTGYSNYV